MRRICVFCGSRTGNEAHFGRLARALGESIARRGHGLVYGGGGIGLMGLVADAAVSGQTEAIGVVPEALTEREVGHGELTRLEVVPDMLSRKNRLIELSDGFITLPGGLGTVDELFEILTWSQLGLIRNPMVLLDDSGYFRSLLRWLDHAVDTGFVDAAHRDVLTLCNDPEEAVRLAAGAAR